MCGGMEHSSDVPNGSCESNVSESQDSTTGDSCARIEALNADSDSISYLLELAAENDLDGFKKAARDDAVKVFGIGRWYIRQYGTARMFLEQRTPAMIAALYGSVDVLKYIVSLKDSNAQINVACGSDGSTVLHCAAVGGSLHAVESIKLLVSHGADLNVVDAQGRRPADLVAKAQMPKYMKKTLEGILKAVHPAEVATTNVDDSQIVSDLHLSKKFSGLNLVGDEVLSVAECTSHPSFCSSSPMLSPGATDKSSGKLSAGEGIDKCKEYPVDPSIPDIKNSIYMTDEFRMFSFKIRPCSRAYSHDWTECPFVHPGENARRRDPRRYHYSCVPCPDFRKGACRRGDMCEYAHGVFECWLHPAQYRTRLCKDGTECTRRVCFFAHTSNELRPLYMSSGSTISPRASLDFVAMSPALAPCAPSSGLMASSFSLSSNAHVNHGTPPLSPSSSPANSLAGAWSSASSVPVLHLPVSRLRSALNARDLSLDELAETSEFDGQLLVDYLSICSQDISTQARLNAAVAASAAGTASSSRTGKYRNLGLSVAPTNLDELFAAEVVSSPRSMMHDPSLMEAQVRSSQIKSQLSNQPISDQLQMQLQQTVLESQRQGSPRLYSPMQTLAPPDSHLLGSPRIFSTQTPSYSPASISRLSALGGLDIDWQTSNCVELGSLGKTSVVGMDVDDQVHNAAALSLGAARGSFTQHDMRSHSSRELGVNCALSDWGSPTGKPEWSTHGDDLSRLRKSTSFGLREFEEADLTWVQALAKQGPKSAAKAVAIRSEDSTPSSNATSDAVDQSNPCGSCMEKLHSDQIIT